MKKQELVRAVASSTGVSQGTARAVIDGTFAAIADQLHRGNKVVIASVGTFAVSARSARRVRNPKTGELMSIKASKSPSFRAAKAFRDRIGRTR